MTTALITGGTAGIGRAFADKFAALGYDLVLVARNQERLDATAEELQGHDTKAATKPATSAAEDTEAGSGSESNERDETDKTNESSESDESSEEAPTAPAAPTVPPTASTVPTAPTPTSTPPIRVETLSADLATPEGRLLVEERLAEKDRPIDILVNNAGFGLNHAFRDGSLDDEERMIDVHIRAVMRLTHAALPGMVLRGKGSIINVASVAAFMPRGTYSAAKAWVVSFSETVAAELHGTGVRCLALCPGMTHTEFHDRADVDVAKIPEWMWLDPADVVDTAIDDLRKGVTVSVPGTQYKLLLGASRLVPRRLSTKLSRNFSKRW